MPASSTRAPRCLAELDHLREIRAQRRDRLAAQAVVAAELDHDDARASASSSSRGRRASPPADVSPAMLAFTTSYPYASASRRLLSIATHDCSAVNP